MSAGVLESSKNLLAKKSWNSNGKAFKTGPGYY